MRLLPISFLAAFALALCVGDQYLVSYTIYTTGVEISFFNRANLSLVSYINLEGFAETAEETCALRGDILYIPFGSQILAVAPGGVIGSVDLPGERVYSVVYACGEVISLSGNHSRACLRAFSPDLKALRLLELNASEAFLNSMQAMGCDVVVVGSNADKSIIYYIANWQVAYVKEVRGYGKLIRDINGSVYFITKERLYKVTRSGLALLWPVGEVHYLARGFGRGGVVYLLMQGKIVVLKPGGVKEEIYGAALYDLGTDGFNLYLMPSKTVLRRHSHVPNGTLTVIARGVEGVSLLNVGVEGIGSARGLLYGPVKVHSGWYWAYIELCGKSIPRRVAVSDGANVYVEIPFDGVWISIDAVDFWGRSAELPAYVTVYTIANAQIYPTKCSYLSPRSKVDVPLLKGGEYLIRYCNKAGVSGVGLYSEESKCEGFRVKIWDNGMVFVLDEDYYSAGIGGGRYVKRFDGVYYAEIITMAVLLGLIYAVDKLIKRRRPQ